MLKTTPRQIIYSLAPIQAAPAQRWGVNRMLPPQMPSKEEKTSSTNLLFTVNLKFSGGIEIRG